MIFSFTLSKAQWVEIAPCVDNALYDIYAITPDIVVAVGDNGTIIKTIDGGETWQQKESGTSNRLTKLQFPTSNIPPPPMIYPISDVGNCNFVKRFEGISNFKSFNIITISNI